uniref:hypothetical protein n=1 Tax=Geitlerinema sp. PCC 9228 TaxID=111611 RepID=UPI001B8D971F
NGAKAPRGAFPPRAKATGIPSYRKFYLKVFTNRWQGSIEKKSDTAPVDKAASAPRSTLNVAGCSRHTVPNKGKIWHDYLFSQSLHRGVTLKTK